MRTFRKIKAFGISTTGATGGKNNEATMFVCGAAAANVTVQSLQPDGSLVYVGPLSLSANQSLIYPAFTYGWTASASVSAYELF
jgi:hypothetical protein